MLSHLKFSVRLRLGSEIHASVFECATQWIAAVLETHLLADLCTCDVVVGRGSLILEHHVC